MFMGYSWEWWITQAFPGLGGVASLILVIYYSRLITETREQTLASKASYAPSLDTTVDFREDEVEVKIVNRGNGGAKGIMMAFDFTAFGETVGYFVDFDTTLGPGQALEYDSQSGTVILTPVVYQITEQGDLFAKHVRLSELFEAHPDGYFEVNIRYTDLIGQEEYTHQLESLQLKNLSEPSMSSISTSKSLPGRWATGPQKITLFGPAHIPLKQRLLRAWDRQREKIRQNNPLDQKQDEGKLHIGPALKENISASVVPAEDSEIES
ncbi:hypothetical protein ABSL23_16990 (plasmid) [Halobacterium sp. NMX12-1]|uniref:DUF4352 domain-containing protein n=1 Tax=Halobacterium sp. NMX12-1 TaxID=3166650 RepID=A0AAU8CHF0_9EURY